MMGYDDLIRMVEAKFTTEKEIPEFRPGDIIRVHERIREGSRERTVVFEGVVLKRAGSGARATVTVRKIAAGVGVERTFYLYSPSVQGIEVVRRSQKVRQARPYYLRRYTNIHQIR